MSGFEMMQILKMNGKLSGKITQKQISTPQTTVSCEKDGKQRVCDVETEAVSFG